MLGGRRSGSGGLTDPGNLYGDDGASPVLGAWWSREGPDADTWRFNLKGAAEDVVGHSFSVYVPNGEGRDRLFGRFVAFAEGLGGETYTVTRDGFARARGPTIGRRTEGTEDALPTRSRKDPGQQPTPPNKGR
jgi:hypothetical protein